MTSSTQNSEQPERVYYPEPYPTPPPPPPKDRTVRRATGAHTLTRRVVDADSPPAGVNHPAYGVETLAAAGSVAYLADAAPWWFAAGGAAAGVVVAWATHLRYRIMSITGFAGAATVAAGGVLAVGATHAPWSGPGLASLAAAALLGGPAYAAVRYRARKALDAQVDADAQKRSEEKKHKWGAILAEAGARDVDVDVSVHDPDTGWRHGERKFTAGFALALRIGARGPTVRSLVNMSPEIERVAAAWLGLPIRTGSIEVVPSGYANTAELIVPTEDVMSASFDIEISDGPLSVNDPLPVCRATDGNWIDLDLMENPHGLISGQTNAGKSNYLHVHTIRLTQCPDDVEWMICGAKPIRNFAAWMQPWLQGHVERPVLDWIAGDIREACRMLLDAYAAIDRRQEAAATNGADGWTPTPAEPRITIQIDESVDFFGSDLEVTTHRDETMTFSELVLEIVRTGRSEGISLISLVQRSTATMMGSDAGNTKSQIQYRVGFRDTGWTDSNAIFTTETNGVDATQLPQGGLYVEMLGYSRPRIAKSPKVNPEHRRYAAIHHAQYCGTVDSWTATVFDHYDERWTRPNQQELLKKICPDSPLIVDGRIEDPNLTTGVPGTPTRPAPASSDDAGTDGSADDHHASPPGDTDGDDGEPLDPTAAVEVDMLEAWLAASADDEWTPDDSARPTPTARTSWGDRLDPRLPYESRQLLDAFSASPLVSDEWVTTEDLRALAADELGWDGSTPGNKRVVRALRDVNVHQPTSRPKRGGKRRAAGYWTADLLEAVDTMSRHAD